MFYSLKASSILNLFYKMGLTSSCCLKYSKNISKFSRLSLGSVSSALYSGIGMQLLGLSQN